LTIHAASGKPYGRPDVKIPIAAPDSRVRVNLSIIPASGLYPCAGMASLPRASCLYILQTLDNTSLLHPRGQLKLCCVVCWSRKPLQSTPQMPTTDPPSTANRFKQPQ